MEKRKTQKAAFPAFPQGPLPETKRTRTTREHQYPQGGRSIDRHHRRLAETGPRSF
jgi:hypothetical protein